MYCPGITTYTPYPLVRVSVYARVTLAVRVLSRDYYLPPCQSIRVCQSNSGSTCTLQGLPPTPYPLVRVSVYARVTLAVHVLSRDYYLPPTPLVRVFVYARVTLAVHVLFYTSNKLRDLGRNTPMWYNYHGWRTFWRRI